MGLGKLLPSPARLTEKYSQSKFSNIQCGLTLLSARLLEIDEQAAFDIQNRHVIA